MIRFVAFDIDGTLLDSVDLHAESWRQTFQHFGKEVPYDQVRHQIGKGSDQLLPVFFTREELDRFGKEMEDYRKQLFQRDFLPRVKPFPQVRALFERLRADGKRIVLASSASEKEVKVYQEMLGIADLLEGKTSKDDVAKSKPHPDIFQAALATLGKVSPRETLAVGDTPYDAEAAAKIHLRTMGVRCGGFPEAELKAAGCIAIYEDPADLLAQYDRTPFVTG